MSITYNLIPFAALLVGEG